jgi:CRISPR system Cascade subunit CasE
MFLSRVELSPRASQNDGFWRDVSQPYGAHQAIWKLFTRSPEQKRDFLFGAEEGAVRPRFFVLSAAAPDGEGSELWDIETKPFAPAFRQGSRLGFRLRASPVIRRASADETGARRSRRHDVIMDEKRRRVANGEPVPERSALVREPGLKWLEGQAAHSGFRLVHDEAEFLGEDGLLEQRTAAAVRVEGYRQHRIQRRGEHPISFSTLDFEGLLEVIDPALFLAKVATGFGPEKAFGCGLMLLRRA